MSTWKDALRHITVHLIEWNNTQRWATVETRVALNYGAPFRYGDVQVGLYCDGEEVAIGYADAQGRWRVTIEGIKRAPDQAIFEAQARLSLGRARNQARPDYQVRADGRGVSAPEKEAIEEPIIVQADEDLRFALPRMIKIKPSTFWMGKHVHAHRVKISRSLTVGAVPVTQELFQLVMGNNPSHFVGEKRPVEQVSFWEAIAFCNKLSGRCGYTSAYHFYEERGQPCVEWNRSSNGYRLLTEAEWEFVAKAGRESQFAGGDHLDDLGWYQENAKHQTQKVGQKDPNAWGLFDCSGNVWEWCFDEWDEAAYDGRKGSLHVDPVVAETPDSDRRVRRGGSWVSFNINCNTNYRFWGRAAAKVDDTGFRIARSL